MDNQVKGVEHAVWKMFFDGSSSKEGFGARVVFIYLAKEFIPLPYKLEFETTNNIVEYTDLLLGLRAAKDMGIDKISIFRDS
jgi:ribonuclease HI